MSSSLVPGWAAMKYGTRCCFLPAFWLARAKRAAKASKAAMPGFIIAASGAGSLCSGATFSRPET